MFGAYLITCPECQMKPGYRCHKNGIEWPFYRDLHLARWELWRSFSDLQKLVARAVWEQSFLPDDGRNDVELPDHEA